MRQGPRRPNTQTRSSSDAQNSRLCCWHEMMSTLKQACFQGYPESAECVQIPIGSRSSAIHNAYHTSLRPSSLFEPRHPSLKVVYRTWQKPARNYNQLTPHGSGGRQALAAQARRAGAHCTAQRSARMPWACKHRTARSALGRADDGSGGAQPAATPLPRGELQKAYNP